MNSPARDNPFQSPQASSDVSAYDGEIVVAQGVFTVQEVGLLYRTLTQKGTTGCLLYVGVLVASMLVVMLFPNGDFWLTSLLVAMASSVPLIAAPFLLREFRFWTDGHWRAMRQSCLESPQEMKVIFSEHGVRLETPAAAEEYSWSQAEQLTSSRQMLVLHLKSGTMIALPAYFFADEVAYQTTISQIVRRIAAPGKIPPPLEEPIPENAIVLQGTPTWDEYFDGYWNLQEPLIWKFAALFTFALVLMATCIVIGLMMHKSIPEFTLTIFMSIGLVILLIGVATFKVLSLRKNYREHVQNVIGRWIITSHGVRTAVDNTLQTLPWTKASMIKIQPKAIYLASPTAPLVLLPKRFFSDEQQWVRVIDWIHDHKTQA